MSECLHGIPENRACDSCELATTQSELAALRAERDRLIKESELDCKLLENRRLEAARIKGDRDRYREALEKIKDGGVPNGVLANVEERMLAMCDIARTALGGEGGGNG